MWTVQQTPRDRLSQNFLTDVRNIQSMILTHRATEIPSAYPDDARVAMPPEESTFDQWKSTVRESLDAFMFGIPKRKNPLLINGKVL